MKNTRVFDKRKGRAWLLAVFVVIAAAGCPIGLIEFDEPKTVNVRLDDINLREYLSDPVAGASPALSFAAPSFIGIVAWKTDGGAVSGPFQANTAYTAELSLHSLEGHTFTGAVYRYGERELSPLPGGTEKRVALEIDGLQTGEAPGGGSQATAVTYLDLTDKIPAPVSGGFPAAVLAAGEYIGIVGWEPNVFGSFAGNTAYTAQVTLYPLAGYTFEGLRPGAFTHAITDAIPPGTVTFGTGSAEKVTLSIAFPQAGRPVGLDLPFSGTAGQSDSVIDMIRAAAGAPFLELKLAGIAEEDVNLAEGTDLWSKGYKKDNPDNYREFKGLFLSPDGYEDGDGFCLPANSPYELVIDGGGRVLDLTGTDQGGLITVGPGVTLTLRNITLKGLNAGEGNNGNNQAIVCVSNNAHLIMEDGAVLRDNYSSSWSSGGGVYVDGEGGKSGTFTMKGGLITGNISPIGGGVFVNQSGIFYLEGGEVRENHAIIYDDYTGSGGGVFLFLPSHGSRVIKSGGAISGNTASGGNQVYVYIDGTNGRIRTGDLGPGDYLWFYYNGSEYGFDQQ